MGDEETAVRYDDVREMTQTTREMTSPTRGQATADLLTALSGGPSASGGADCLEGRKAEPRKAGLASSVEAADFLSGAFSHFSEDRAK